MNAKPKTTEHPKTRAGGPTWPQTLAMLLICGITVFAVTRQMYMVESTGIPVAGSSLAMPPTASPDQLNVSPAMLESLLSLSPEHKDPATISMLANQYFDQRQYQEAADLYGQLSELDPANVDNLNNLGLTLHYIGRSDEALQVLARGSKLDPGNQRIWLTLGFVNKSLGNFDAAKSSLQTAEHINPDSDVGKSATSMLAEL